jgi:glucokinase
MDNLLRKTVLTLDAGGTNFVFSAIRNNDEVVKPVVLPSNAHNLELCLTTIKKGFKEIIAQLSDNPDAISFAFPGPADYPNGIIGDLFNLPCFRGGVPLGGILENEFQIPVFINNDGDLYAYGEALAGFLPYINKLFEAKGKQKRFKNIAGFTLGTGFGAGIVIDGHLLLGDNSAGAEVWLLRNKINPKTNAEEGISIRAIKRVYASCCGLDESEVPEPHDIYKIGKGLIKGNREAAVEAFRQLGEVLGDAVSHVLTLTDSIAVIGGGIAGAGDFILPALLNEMRSSYIAYSGKVYPRLAQKVFNLEDQNELNLFIEGDTKEIIVNESNKTYYYDSMKRVGVGFSKIGTSKAIALGAYHFAINRI